jgi:hypothetical protein
MIRSVMYGFALVFASASWAQAPPLGAVVQTQHYDPATNLVTLTIANVSHKDITAYNMSIKETYADGHVNNHEMMADYVGRIALVKEYQGTPEEAIVRQQLGDGLFHSGDTRQEIVGVRPGLKDIQVVIDVVTYADQTAEATNADGLKRMIDHRKQEIASTKLADDIIKAALTDPNDASPSTTAAKKIQEQITLFKAQKHTTLDLETGTLQGVVDELKGISSRDALSKYLTKSEERISTLAPHAKGGPQ